RVRVDIPNGLDSDWHIDVKKASATPPRHVRDRFRRIIDTIGGTSKRVYTGRGARLVSNDRLPVWERGQDKNTISYQVNMTHPGIAEFVRNLTDSQVNDFRHVMQLTGASLPLDALFADMGDSPAAVKAASVDEDTLTHALGLAWNELRGSGIAADEALAMLQV